MLATSELPMADDYPLFREYRDRRNLSGAAAAVVRRRLSACLTVVDAYRHRRGHALFAAVATVTILCCFGAFATLLASDDDGMSLLAAAAADADVDARSALAGDALQKSKQHAGTERKETRDEHGVVVQEDSMEVRRRSSRRRAA